VLSWIRRWGSRGRWSPTKAEFRWHRTAAASPSRLCPVTLGCLMGKSPAARPHRRLFPTSTRRRRQGDVDKATSTRRRRQGDVDKATTSPASGLVNCRRNRLVLECDTYSRIAAAERSPSNGSPPTIRQPLVRSREEMWRDRDIDNCAAAGRVCPPAHQSRDRLPHRSTRRRCHRRLPGLVSDQQPLTPLMAAHGRPGACGRQLRPALSGLP
jgi:hypothetical protein